MKSPCINIHYLGKKQQFSQEQQTMDPLTLQVLTKMRETNHFPLNTVAHIALELFINFRVDTQFWEPFPATVTH